MQTITIQLKRLGKKRVKNIPVEIDEIPKTLKDLIKACVRMEVKKYNDKREDVQLLSFLSPADIQKQGEGGKIGFGDLANTTLAVEEKAIENALLAYKDGLFVVFVDDNEVTDLEQPLSLNNESVVAFIRMTFLSGGYW